jgi:hypothetical protein
MILQAAAGTVKFNSGKADQQKVALLGPQGMPRFCHGQESAGAKAALCAGNI